MTNDGRLFDAYIFVDWSATSTPAPPQPRPDTVWVGEYTAGDETPRERYCRTRQAAVEQVLESLRRHVVANRRVLVGFDFPYGYPAGLAGALGLAGADAPWRQVWRELSAQIVDGPTNASNRFEAAPAAR